MSTDRYQLVTAQATLEDYKLQLKQLLELDGENEMNIYLPALSDENVLAPLPTKKDVYISALSLRPEIEASKLNVEASELGIGRSKLYLRIKEITGLTPNELTLKIKLEEAMYLLNNQPNLNISEISYQLGFSSPRYFSKCFKSFYGVSPQNCRKGVN